MTLTPEQIEAIKKEAQAQVEARRSINENTVMLWQSRINMAVAAGDEQALREAIKAPALAGDVNCVCGGQLR